MSHLDAVLVSKLTTWRPDKNVSLGWPSVYALTDKPQNRIDLLFEPTKWAGHQTFYIGVYNSDLTNSPVDFTIRIR